MVDHGNQLIETQDDLVQDGRLEEIARHSVGERSAPVFRLIGRGQQVNRDVLKGETVSQPMENFQSVEVGEMEIEQDNVRSLLGVQGRKVAQGFDPILAANDGLLEPGMPEKYFADRGEVLVVLHMDQPK